MKYVKTALKCINTAIGICLQISLAIAIGFAFFSLFDQGVERFMDLVKKSRPISLEDERKANFCSYACGSYVVQKVLDNNRCVCNTSLVIREAE